MSDRWTNAVITLTVPVDLPKVSTPINKSHAALEMFECLLPNLPDNVVATIRYEDVADGAPIAAARGRQI